MSTPFGIVATSEVEASQAGARMLERGGSAIDAGIAANAVLGVMEPMMNGVGGDLFAIYYDAKTGKLTGINASGWAPKGLTIEHLKSKGLDQMPYDGIDSVTVPGAVDGWANGKSPRPVASRTFSASSRATVKEVPTSRAKPLVLAGNCISCIGTLAGLGDPPPAIIWLDAHGDFNTPESTISGFLDGIALATAVGRCWGKLAATVPGFRPAPETQVVLLGARDFDVDEHALLARSAVSLIDAQRIRKHGLRAALEPLLPKIQTHTDRAYLHIDLDVLDPAEARVNHFAPTGGLTLAELLEIPDISLLPARSIGSAPRSSDSAGPATLTNLAAAGGKSEVAGIDD